MAIERSEIDGAIRGARGNISDAARTLGASRRTLQNRMRFYKMPRGRSGRPRKSLRRRGGIARVVLAGAAIAGVVLLVRSSRSA